MIVTIALGFGAAAAVASASMAALLFAVRLPSQSLGETARIVPDSVRLAAALYRDRTLPAAVRWRVRIALIYNLQPLNLIPDVIPVIGIADNVAVLTWAVRGAVRTAGWEAVERHWKGNPASLATLYEILRLSGTPMGTPEGRAAS